MTHPPLKRVLVPLDGSSQSEAALEEALELFPQADVRVLHVLQVRKVAGDGTKSGYELAVEEAEAIRETAEEIATEHGRGVETETIEGNTEKTIIRNAKSNDIDHIVMGSRGQSGLKQALLGSVATAVVRRAPAPVTVVPERSEKSTNGAERNRILVPVDGSAAGTAALRYAIETFPDAEFTVIHVIDPVKGYGEAREQPLRRTEQWREDTRDRTEQLFETVETLADEHGITCSTMTRTTLTGTVPHAILTCAEDIDADHIVVGNPNRSRLTKALLGSVSEAIVRRSSVPVTVVR